jgi:hypothetical protein
LQIVAVEDTSADPCKPHKHRASMIDQDWRIRPTSAQCIPLVRFRLGITTPGNQSRSNTPPEFWSQFAEFPGLTPG